MQQDPFAVTFGQKPVVYVERPHLAEEILDMFRTDPITNQFYVLRGPHGSGKTVLLSDIANRFEEDPQWIVVRCDPESPGFSAIANALREAVYSGNYTAAGESDESYAFEIEGILKWLAGRDKKILFAVDAMADTPQMQNFLSHFQLWMCKELPVFFLGTATYENMQEIQDAPCLTFLYRAPKIDLFPLDPLLMAESYQAAFGIPEAQGLYLANFTKGYAFAFQALGHLYWDAKPAGNIEDLLPDFDALLADSAYSAIWRELSLEDRILCQAVAKSGSGKAADIKANLPDTVSGHFRQWCLRLKNQGLVDLPVSGSITFALPRFREFVKHQPRKTSD